MEIDFQLIVPPSDEALYSAWNSALNERLPAPLRKRFRFVRARLDGKLLPPETKFDVIVSPANSYGRLDGAFDEAISRLLSPADDYLALTRHAQSELYVRWRGFAPPGTATLVALPPRAQGQKQDQEQGQQGGEGGESGDTPYPYGCTHLLLCPTMHFPSVIKWHHDIVYNTTWALLSELDRHNNNNNSSSSSSNDAAAKPIQSVLMPALGTGVGRLPVDRFASQFALAVKNFDEAVRQPEKWKAMQWSDAQPVWEELERTLEDEMRDPLVL